MSNIFRLFVFSLIAFAQMEGYFATISTVFRDEATYFKEWIEYHRLIGFDHFILYDDNSADNYMEVLQPYIDQGLVELVDWSFYRREVNKSFHEVQRGAYRDSLKKCQKHSEWMVFLDIDEFVLPMQDRSLRECLQKHFANRSAVYITWRNFGTNNLYLRPGESLVQYLTACSERHDNFNRIGKTIVRPQHVDIGLVWTIHHCPLKNGHSFADGDGKEILFRGRDMENLSHHDTYIRINHYFYRDESYMRYNKLPRVMNRGLSEEQVYEQNRRFMKEKDFRILRFIDQHYLRQWKSIWQK